MFHSKNMFSKLTVGCFDFHRTHSVTPFFCFWEDNRVPQLPISSLGLLSVTVLIVVETCQSLSVNGNYHVLRGFCEKY